MNSSTQQLTNIIIDCSIIVLSVISISLSIAIFGFIIYSIIKRRNSPHRVALLLTANMYFALLFSGIIVLIQYTRVLPGHLFSLTSLNDGIYCQIRAYLQWVALCAVCYSNSLQAVYRLCRVIFYTKPLFQSFQLYRLVIIIQWIICFLIMFPALIVGDFQYSTNDYYCENHYFNIRGILLNGTIAYSIPLSITTGCYVYTLRKLRGRNNSNLLQTMSQIERISARRDLIVLFRICVLLVLLMMSSPPSVILLIVYSLSGYLPWWSAQIQSLIFSLSTAIATIVLLLISPHLQYLWTKTTQRPAALVSAIIRIH